MSAFRTLLLILLTPLLLLSATVQNNLSQSLLSVSLPFIQNRGQLPEQVAFYANTFGGTLFVTNDGKLVYYLPADPNRGWVIREEFPKALKIKVEGRERAEAKVNIFKGKKSIKGIPSYRGVSVGEVAEGVFLHLKAYGNNVEKLFYVKPGADPERIVVKVEGGKGLELTEEGELVVKTDYGDIRFTKPAAYQEVNGRREYVEASYVLLGEGTYGFKVGKYDRSRTLVIDPLLASTYLGGSNTERIAYPCEGIAVDNSGNVYVTGWTQSNDFPATTGAYDEVLGGGSDAFVAKFDSNLQLISATYLGGSSGEQGCSLAINSSGNVYVAGFTWSADFPTVSAYDDTHNGGQDIFISLLSSDLSSLLASTYLGGSSSDRDVSIALDSAGNVYVAGTTQSADFPVTNSSSFSGGTTDAFVSKLSSNLGNLIASTYLGGSGNENAYAIAVDQSGYIYVGGWTGSTADFPTTPGVYAETTSASVVEFITKFDSNLDIVKSTFLNSRSSGYGIIRIRPFSGDLYLVSRPGAVDKIYRLTSDLSSITAVGLPVFCTDFGSGYSITGLRLDSTGEIYLSGDNDLLSAQKFYVAKASPDFKNIYMLYTFGGTGGSHDSRGSVIDSSDNITIVGEVYNVTDYPVTTGVTAGGSWDIVISKFSLPLPGSPVLNSFTADVTSGEAPLTVTFSWNVSDPDGDTVNCTLQIRKGASYTNYTINDCVNNTSQQHTFNDPGTYEIYFKGKDGNGGYFCYTNLVQITVTSPNNPPVINSFTANPDTGDAPLTVIFSWNVSDPDGDTLTCTLDINNDGTADYTVNDCASNTSQTHTYSTAGSYTAVLTVDDGKGGLISQNVQVSVSQPNAPPVINTFSANPNTGTAPLDVTFSWNVSDPDGDPLTCTLDPGDGTPTYTISNCASNTSQTHTYTSTGSFTAVLRVEDGNGNSAVGNVSVDVSLPPNSPPAINTFSANPDAGAAPLNVTFTWNVSDPDGDTLTCRLDVDGDGSSDYTINDCANNTSQTHTYSSEGDYTVVLTVEDGRGGQDSAQVTVTVSSPQATNNPPAVGSFSADPDTGNAPLDVTFRWNVSDPDGDVLTCRLDVNNDGTADYTINDCANNTSQTHTYESAGTYTAVLTVEDSRGGTAQAEVIVEVMGIFGAGCSASGGGFAYGILLVVAVLVRRLFKR